MVEVSEPRGPDLARGISIEDLPEGHMLAGFFWSQHYDVPINYVGHAEQWDKIDIEGDVKSRDCMLRYYRNGKVLAAASIFRDIDSSREELAMERAASRGGQTSGA